MPPAPNGATISYGPNLAPEVNGICARHYGHSPEGNASKGSDDCGQVVGKADNRAVRSVRWLDSDFVVDGTLNPLFTTEVSFGRLNGKMPKQKLDLLP